MELNDVLDHEVDCSMKEHGPRLRAEECTGKIPAGQRHFSQHGMSLEVNRDDWNDPRNRPRTCVHCVRFYNWRSRYKDEKLLVKVELTYSDGTRRVLEGDAADDWSSALNGAAILAWNHGMESKPQPWKEIPPPGDGK